MKKAILLSAVLLATITGAALEGPTMGWSSWNTYRINISDSLIMRQADALVELGLDSLGYRHINIDDGFFGGRNRLTGRLLFHPSRFPRGLKPVTDHIHRLGLKAGIYSDAGANTCGNFWDNDTIARGVGLYGHDREDCILYFSELGFDFIKVDFCGGDPRQNTDSLELRPEQRYRAIRAAIEAAGRPDVRLNVCRWDFPGTWAADVASSWRISHDISPSWASVKDIISQNLYLSAYAGGGHYNDMDMLELGRGLTDDEERTHFGLWCIMASPLLIGCDLTALPASTLALLSNRSLIALNQDSLGLQAYVAKRDADCYLLVKDIENRNSTTRAIAVYNPTDSVRQLTFSFAEVDLASPVKATNLFDSAVRTLTGDTMTVTLRPHATEIFRLDASRRLIRSRYEAETAFLTEYQELINPLAARTAFYESDQSCSGGMKVTNGGYTVENDIVFRDIYMPATVATSLTIRCRASRESKINVEINGVETATLSVAPSDGFSDVTLPASLRRGDNTVRLYSESGPLPDIDYIDVVLPAE